MAAPLFARCRPLAAPVLALAEAAELARLLQALADPQRLRILNLFVRAQGEPFSVGELVAALALRQPTVSYHLGVLTAADLVERQRRGTYGFYRLAAGALEGVAALLGSAPPTNATVAAPKGSEPAADVAAALLLRQAAKTARQQPPPLLARGHYLYHRSLVAQLNRYQLTGGGSCAALVPRLRQRWLGADAGRLRETNGQPSFPSSHDEQAWRAAARPALGPAPIEQTLPALAPLDLSSNPDALQTQLTQQLAGAGGGPESSLFQRLGELLGEPTASAPQRFALYTVCARIAQLELIGPVSDPAGRPGRAVAHSDNHGKIQQRLILHPDSSTLLASEQLTLTGHQLGYPAGTRLAHTTHQQTAIVATIATRPDDHPAPPTPPP
jgi:ArsR family transcriptional regulator